MPDAGASIGEIPPCDIIFIWSSFFSEVGGLLYHSPTVLWTIENSKWWKLRLYPEKNLVARTERTNWSKRKLIISRHHVNIDCLLSQFHLCMESRVQNNNTNVTVTHGRHCVIVIELPQFLWTVWYVILIFSVQRENKPNHQFWSFWSTKVYYQYYLVLPNSEDWQS